MAGIGWLHVSDLHQGLTPQQWLWPNIREQLFADLVKLHKVCGPWDIVTFTGDLTQRGAESEFAFLNDTLTDLWIHLAKLGSHPALLAVPGNHDLVRPNPKDPAVKLLGQWGNDAAVMREFWDDADSPYRAVVDNAFANHVAWSRSHQFPRPGIHRDGLLPGDFSATLEKDGLTLGILGLNTAFLQLTGGNYQGKLDIDSTQFHQACGGDGAAWAKRHHVNLLMTHHPPDWLRKPGQLVLSGEVAPAGRFTAHLFGHMHEGRSKSVSIGGAAVRRYHQAPSLFGLEHWGDAQEDRSHGYFAGRFVIEGKDVLLKLWPRVGVKNSQGAWKIVPALQEFELADDGSTTEKLASGTPAFIVEDKNRPKDKDALGAVAGGGAGPPVAASPAPIGMSGAAARPPVEELVGRFLGGDPLAGTAALRELLVLGEKGEDALLGGTMSEPKTMQVSRRLLRYVASRGRGIVDRLLRRFKKGGQRGDTYTIPLLFAGLEQNDDALKGLFEITKAADFDDLPALFDAWGYAGGEPSYLWRRVRDSSLEWEKFLTFAFRAACSSVSRVSASGLWVIQELITHHRVDGTLQEIGLSPDSKVSNHAVSGGEMVLEGFRKFGVWRRGEVADGIFRDWAVHEHWRVREFGAEIVTRLGFSRTTTPVVQWLAREKVPSVRGNLLTALEQSDTDMGADVLLNVFKQTKEGRSSVARAATRAPDRQQAISVLNDIAQGDDVAAAEALVSLARLGQTFANVGARLDSPSYYTRLSAALAVGYTGDARYRDRLSVMRGEAANSMERVFLAAAHAIAERKTATSEALHRELIASNQSDEYNDRADLYRLNRSLKTAVLDGLAAAGESTARLVDAWRAETEPFDPVPQGVDTF